MSENTQPTPAAPSTPAAAPAPAPFNPPRMAIDYSKVMADAVAKTAPKAPAAVTPAPEAPPPAPAEAAPAEPPAPVEEKKPEVPAEAPDGVKKSFERLAKETAALREAQARVKHLEVIGQRFSTGSIQALVKAAEAGDPVAAMEALGITPDVYEAAVAGRKPTKAPAKEQGGDDPRDAKIAELEAKLNGLSGTVQQRAVQEGRAAAMSQIKNIAAKGQFEFVSDDADAPAEALAIVEDFVRKNGVIPREELDGVFEAALKVVDDQRKAAASVWEQRLTKKGRLGTLPPNGAPASPPPAVSEQARPSRTLTNSVAAPSRPATTPKTAEDYQAAAIAAALTFDKSR